jgi:hypothetical protein
MAGVNVNQPSAKANTTAIKCLSCVTEHRRLAGGNKELKNERGEEKKSLSMMICFSALERPIKEHDLTERDHLGLTNCSKYVFVAPRSHAQPPFVFLFFDGQPTYCCSRLVECWAQR